MTVSDLARLLALSAIWGASFLFIRIGAPVLGPLTAAFLRVLIGAVTLAGCLVLLRVRWDMRGKWPAVMALGVINSGIPFVMYAVAALWLPAGYSAVFNAMTPLMGVLIGTLFFAERLTRCQALGVVLGVAGVAVLTRSGPVAFTAQVLLGAAKPAWWRPPATAWPASWRASGSRRAAASTAAWWRRAAWWAPRSSCCRSAPSRCGSTIRCRWPGRRYGARWSPWACCVPPSPTSSTTA